MQYLTIPIRKNKLKKKKKQTKNKFLRKQERKRGKKPNQFYDKNQMTLGTRALEKTYVSTVQQGKTTDS